MGVCIYYRNFLPLKLISIHYLNECITFVRKLGDKICNFGFYRSPNQSKDDFENFCDNFELTLDALLATNPFLIVAIGYFNGNSNNWYTGDTTTFEGSNIEAITSQSELQQVINEPTHIQGKSESCIDFIFASQPNLMMGWGINSPLYHNCHDQVNLKVHYLQPYQDEAWHCEKVNTDHIQRAVNGFPWERSFTS